MYNKLKNNNIITSNIDFTFIYTDKHILLTILGETEKTELLSSKIEEKMNNLEITEEELVNILGKDKKEETKATKASKKE